MEDRNLRILLDIGNDTVGRQMAHIIKKAEDFSLVKDGGPLPPDLLIAEINGNAEAVQPQIDAYLKNNAGREVFLTAHDPDPKLLLWAMKTGIRTVFTQPLKDEEVHQALAAFKTRMAPAPDALKKSRGRIISVMGSKGGVGATTIAVNLAVALSGNGKNCSVALLDMNNLFGEVPLFMEIEPQLHWGDITKNIDRLDETFLMNVLFRHDTGVHVLPSPGYLNGHRPPTPEIMARLLGLMETVFDLVVIDCGQATDENALKTFQLSSDLLLITTLSLPCLANTNKLLRSLVDLGYVEKEHVKVVLNRFVKRSDISIADAEAGIGQPLFWRIPNDYLSTMAAINQGKPLIEAAPKTKIAKNIKNLALHFMPAEKSPSRRRWRLFGG